MDIQSNEQWKLDGDCSVCRRQKYCHTECTAARKYRRMAIARAFRETQAEKMLSMLPQYGEEKRI